MRDVPPGAVVRARGLRTRLSSREQRAELAALPGLGGLSDALGPLGYPPVSPEPGEEAPRSLAAAIDTGLRLGTARRRALLLRWLGSAAPAFAPVLTLEAEREALRALMRGAASGRPPAARRAALAGLAPELDLPESTVRELAACEGLPELVRALSRSQHPVAPALAAALRASGPDPFALELAVSRALWARARRASRRYPSLSAWVRREIDFENAWTALLADDPRSADAFLEGGERIDAQTFAAIARGRDTESRRRRLAEALGSRPVAEVLADASIPATQLEERIRGARLLELERAARRDPLGAAPLLLAELLLRDELEALRRIAWRMEQGLPGRAGGGQAAAP